MPLQTSHTPILQEQTPSLETIQETLTPLTIESTAEPVAVDAEVTDVEYTGLSHAEETQAEVRAMAETPIHTEHTEHDECAQENAAPSIPVAIELSPTDTENLMSKNFSDELRKNLALNQDDDAVEADDKAEPIIMSRLKRDSEENNTEHNAEYSEGHSEDHNEERAEMSNATAENTEQVTEPETQHETLPESSEAELSADADAPITELKFSELEVKAEITTIPAFAEEESFDDESLSATVPGTKEALGEIQAQAQEEATQELSLETAAQEWAAPLELTSAAVAAEAPSTVTLIHDPYQIQNYEIARSQDQEDEEDLDAEEFTEEEYTEEEFTTEAHTEDELESNNEFKAESKSEEESEAEFQEELEAEEIKLEAVRTEEAREEANAELRENTEEEVSHKLSEDAKQENALLAADLTEQEAPPMQGIEAEHEAPLMIAEPSALDVLQEIEQELSHDALTGQDTFGVQDPEATALEMAALAAAVAVEEQTRMVELEGLLEEQKLADAERLAAQIAEDEALEKEQAEAARDPMAFINNDPEVRAAMPWEPEEDEDGNLDLREMESCIEALIFMSDKPLSTEKLHELLGPEMPLTFFDQALEKLVARYQTSFHGFELIQVAGGYQFRTKPGRAALAKKLARVITQKLSTGAMETLAIVAYKQPVLKDEVDKVRGVDSSHFIRGLLDKKLIKISGRSELPGRPMLYATTQDFLEVFGLGSLRDMPALHEIEKMIPSSQSGADGEDPRVKQMRELVGEMKADTSTTLLYDPKQDEEFLTDIRNRVNAIPTSTPYIDEQKALEKAEKDSKKEAARLQAMTDLGELGAHSVE